MREEIQITKPMIESWVKEHGRRLESRHWAIGDTALLLRHELRQGDVGDRGYRLPWFFQRPVGVGGKMADVFRLRKGELTVWHGFNHSGKSTVVNHVFLKLIEDRAKTAMMSPEYSVGGLLALLLRTLRGRGQLTEDMADVMAEWAGVYGNLYDVDGKMEPLELCGVIALMATEFGVEHVFIDNLTTTLKRSRDYEGQAYAMAMLKEVVRNYNIGVHLIAHDGKPDAKADGKVMGRYKIRGASEVADIADNIIGVDRNEAKHDGLMSDEISLVDRNNFESEPDGQIVVQKQRLVPRRGSLGIYFDPDSLQMRTSATYKAIEWPRFDQLIANMDDSFVDPFEDQDNVTSIVTRKSGGRKTYGG